MLPDRLLPGNRYPPAARGGNGTRDERPPCRLFTALPAFPMAEKTGWSRWFPLRFSFPRSLFARKNRFLNQEVNIQDVVYTYYVFPDAGFVTWKTAVFFFSRFLFLACLFKTRLPHSGSGSLPRKAFPKRVLAKEALLPREARTKRSSEKSGKERETGNTSSGPQAGPGHTGAPRQPRKPGQLEKAAAKTAAKRKTAVIQKIALIE